MSGEQVSRHAKTFPVVDENDSDEEGPVKDDAGYEPKPDDEAEDTGGPPLTPEQQVNINKIHNNCGDPSKAEFLRCLRLSGAQGRVLKYVRKQFKCSACDAKGHMPKARLPASLPRTFRFNETVGIDLVEVEDPWHNKHTFVNMTCWGTIYHIWANIGDKKATTVANVLQDAWVKYFGAPVTIVADLGSEFTGSDFQDKCDQLGTFVHYCDSKAPWQTARTERHGDLLKKQVIKAAFEYTPSTIEAWLQLVSECNSAKNRLSNRSGYSPVQRVFGTAHRLPGDLTSDDHVHPDIFRDLAATDPSFEEARQIREAACKAHASVSIRDRFDEAVQARWRRPTESFKPDDVIILWRQPNPIKGGKW